MTNSIGKYIEARLGDRVMPIVFESLPRVDDTVRHKGVEYTVSAVVWEQEPNAVSAVLHPVIQLAQQIPWNLEEDTWRDMIGVDLSRLIHFGLSVRTHNALKRAGYKYVQDIAGPDDDDLLAARNFGQKSLDELNEAIAKYKDQ